MTGADAKLTLAQVTSDQLSGDDPEKVIRIRTTLRNNQNQTEKTIPILGTLDGKMYTREAAREWRSLKALPAP